MADRGGTIPQRKFGKHDVTISALGLGGHHLGEAKSYGEAERIVHGAVDGGITFFDNCWEYHEGRSEDWMGRALKGRRDKVFLMTKACSHGRDKKLALRMLDESLRRLQTDHLDLWQLHGVGFDNEPEEHFLKDRDAEALLEARQQGKVRFVGFTGHKSPQVHLAMLQSGFPFDSVQMPLNPFDSQYRSFAQTVLPEAQKRGVAVLGMKPLGGTGDAIKKGIVTAEELLRYAMSLPVACTITGFDKPSVLEQNLKIAQGFEPMTEAELEAVRAKCKATAADGRFELYKMGLKYDNPEARLAHGYPVDQQQKEIKERLDVSNKEEPH